MECLKTALADFNEIWQVRKARYKLYCVQLHKLTVLTTPTYLLNRAFRSVNIRLS